MEENTKKFENSLFSRKIGSLWLRKDKTDRTYLSGSFELDGKTIKIIIYKNDRKKLEKHPDYEIFLSEPRIKDDFIAPPKIAENNEEEDSPI